MIITSQGCVYGLLFSIQWTLLLPEQTFIKTVTFLLLTLGFLYRLVLCLHVYFSKVYYTVPVLIVYMAFYWLVQLLLCFPLLFASIIYLAEHLFLTKPRKW